MADVRSATVLRWILIAEAAIGAFSLALEEMAGGERGMEIIVGTLFVGGVTGLIGCLLQKRIVGALVSLEGLIGGAVSAYLVLNSGDGWGAIGVAIYVWFFTVPLTILVMLLTASSGRIIANFREGKNNVLMVLIVGAIIIGFMIFNPFGVALIFHELGM